MRTIIVALVGFVVGWVVGAYGISLVNPWLLLIVAGVVFGGVLAWVIVTLSTRPPG